MKLRVFLLVWSSFSVTQQAEDGCVCELIDVETTVPREQLVSLNKLSSSCGQKIQTHQTLDLERLLLGLEHRLPQLLEDVDLLEKEDDGDLVGALSLKVVENELLEIQQMLQKLNVTTRGSQRLADETREELQVLTNGLKGLEQFDSLGLVSRQMDNKRLKRDLDQCREQHQPPSPSPAAVTCPHGRFLNVSGARINTAGEYPGAYKLGAWGRDPRPEPGQEGWYWLVPLTSNRYANYVRRYTSLSSLMVGVSIPGNVQIHASNPTTNTIQGSNVVLFAGSLYYNCYNQPSVCRFKLATREISTVQLPEGTRFNSKGNFCHLEECYTYTDLDLSTDESGVWVVYTSTQHFGNIVLSRVEASDPPVLGRTWVTSVYKQSVTNTFVACGVLYATRFVDKATEEIFYSLDTSTGVETFDVGVFIQKTSTNIYSLNYSPVDRTLYAYCDANMVAYRVLFESDGMVDLDAYSWY